VMGRGLENDSAQTMAFATVGAAELAFVFSCRSATEPPWRLPSNRYLLGAVAASASALAAIIYLPFLQAPFSTSALGPLEVAGVLACAALPAAAAELVKAAQRRRGR
jgi:magnesium-transporting ATPase (P-type)